ncbi:hypothetical protein HMPREF1545_00660 [Oscillibacter sp. KLE 1728]|nr:hypothetical protein HMPREF1545_00660 [Oscillibacter sp. KLE 1728]ERK68075.1 hypothetical protein HMPREF1546_00233 [Oscillibacter sp. KLE 1745]
MVENLILQFTKIFFVDDFFQAQKYLSPSEQLAFSQEFKVFCTELVKYAGFSTFKF